MIDLNGMTEADLRQLMSQAERALRDRHQQRIHGLRKEAEELAASLGMTVAEVFGLEKAQKSMAGKKVAPKYINPANPAETWTGRGKRPRWLADALNAGASLSQFAV
ncbi:H-NS family nucleoid-associated regulatory protein [Halothiobacillus sp. DCM-1]|uniref:H-NS histone family protein n=1 Tax=Halothiobacillus sp. DCM-1 TaxID=3112558 RepID=UPI00324EB4EA